MPDEIAGVDGGSTTAAMVQSPVGRGLLRLLEMIEEENAILSEHRVVAHGAFAERKNQILKELMAAQRNGSNTIAVGENHGVLNRLKLALGRNACLLRLHIASIGEVSDIIIAGIQEAESDGTYSRGARRAST